MTPPAVLLPLVFLGLSAACTTPHPPTAVKHLVEEATASARDHVAAAEPHEAHELVRAVLGIDPDYAPARGVERDLPDDLESIYRSRTLGSNLAKRVPVERSTTAKVLFYPLDRILDLLDIFSVDLHVGGGAFVNYHFTRALQAGIGLRATTGLGWHERRSLGNKSQAESGITLVALGAEASAATLAGTSGVYSSADTITGLHRPSSPSYQEYRDYWAIGESVTIAFLGIDWDFHPVQVADFVAGWATVDFLNDDFAGTRGLDLSRRERRWIADLYKLEREPETLAAYSKLRESERAAAADAASSEGPGADDRLEERLERLDGLLERGLISEEEHERRRDEILGGL